MKVFLSLVLCALGGAGLASAAPEFYGTVTGSIDGHAIDMRVVCEREPTPGGGWLQAKSDASMHGGNQDRDGDGIATSVNASRSAPPSTTTTARARAARWSARSRST